MFTSKWLCFSECCFFKSFYSGSDVWRNGISTSLLLPIALLFSCFLLLDNGAEIVAGGSNSSSSPASALILLLFCHWPTLNLHLPSTWVFIHFPSLDFKNKCTYGIGCMGQAFSSWPESCATSPEFKWSWLSHSPWHLSALGIKVPWFLVWQDC